MRTPFDVPGFFAGFRFINDPRYWDADNQQFLDLAGYGMHCKKTAGTVTFGNHAPFGREGILLDNSCQFQIEMSNPWEITVLAIVKGHVETGNQINRLLLFGDAVTSSSNGQLHVNANVSATSLVSTMATPNAGQSTGNNTHTEDVIFATAFGFDQETRKAYRTTDGITVPESAAATATVNGNATSPGWNGNIGLSGLETNRYVRVGNLSGVIGDTAPNATNYLNLFGLFFHHGRTLRPGSTQLAKFKAWLDTEKAWYGAA
jgi:hypothetical protein